MTPWPKARALPFYEIKYQKIGPLPDGIEVIFLLNLTVFKPPWPGDHR